MPIQDCITHTKLLVAQETQHELTPQQTSTIGCILSGLMCAAPAAIQCFIDCLARAANRGSPNAANQKPSPCDKSNADHEIYRGVLHIDELVNDATGNPLTVAQADIIGCVFSALVCGVPTFLKCFLECMAGPTTPPAGGYDPGDRKRCE